MSSYDSSPSYSSPAVPPVPETAPQVNVGKGKGRIRRFAASAGPIGLARIILGAVLGLLFILTWLTTGPAIVDSGPSDWKSELAAAGVKNDVNNGETKGAPQQTVVNGWYANDIASVMASQNTYIAASSARNGTLLTLVGLGVAGELILRGLERTRRSAAITGNSQRIHDVQ